MKYGFYLPTRGDTATADGLVSMVQNAERLRFNSVMIADHIVFPTNFDSPYPYTVDGGFPGQGDAFEQLSLMSFIAGKTNSLRLVSSVMILPHRNPIVTAKMLATIDVLSKGRVTVGVGVGWMREEFEALDAPDFDKRGAASNEFIEIFKKAWTEDPVSFEGEFYSFKELRCMPQPVQNPHPPIWIGGHSKPAMRRVAKYGDGWHPVGSIAATPLPPALLKEKFDEIKRMAEAHGRDPETITISYKAPIYDAGVPVDGAERKPFTGSFEQIAEDVQSFKDVGVSELVFDFRAPTFDESIERMNAFGDGVMPLTD
ncbi:MAG: putative F420-dependent oxidoreductase [Alphaproteobacteria bacterium]|jgi:probable F420-dependent oxidoreductase